MIARMGWVDMVLTCDAVISIKGIFRISFADFEIIPCYCQTWWIDAKINIQRAAM